MTKPLTVLKCVGPKLVPFFKTVAIFFVLFSETKSTLFYCVIKCLPIVSLIVFVLLHGMNLSEYYSYSRRIILGLVFSALGDICLVWKEQYFLHGLCMFAIAHIMYTSAFGFKPFNPYALTILAAIGTVLYHNLLPFFHDEMTFFGAVYMLIISMMGWRAIARVQYFDDLWTWTKLCSCVGSILFMISDTLIAVDKFVVPVPHSHTLIMLTYYIAQLGLALSVVDSQVDLVIQQTANPTSTPWIM